MPLYEFRCETGHETEHLLPMSTTTREISCPECGTLAKRRVSAPAVSSADPARMKLLDSTAQSAHEPAVVNSIPSSPRKRPTPVTRNPKHQALPRP